MDLAILFLFILTFGSILVLPGPNSAFAVGQSLKFGVISSLVVPLGFMSATGLHAIFIFSGIGLIIQEYSLALSILKWLGVLYLLWLAYKSFISKPLTIVVSPKEISKLKMYFSAMFLSLTNPKGLLASLIVYPLFLSAEYVYTEQAVILSFSAMAISFSVYSLYSLAALALKNRLASSKLTNQIVGSMYLGAASVLAAKST
ncbi:Putative LysE family protein [Oleispira antarctica RB-8]|uniref:Putative LysE family protein n=1 Tax=Oleispira antarctica RB-8 TaxID=698738 RepID=R4YQS1_OLEAN|nr:Putative LysE family protein [Oleispira antarctica RB-8]